MRQPLIQIRNLSKTYINKGFAAAQSNRSKKVFENLSLNIMPGECLALIGQSGGGKSTLGRCLIRLIKPDSGSIFFNGTNLLALSQKEFRKQRPKIQLIFQDALLALNPRHTIASTLTEPLRVLFNFSKKDALKRAEELLESVGMQRELLNRLPKELSGGQRQRVAIARALSTSPKFLIADEPTSSLDAKNKNQIIRLLKDLQIRFDLTLLLISHDLSMVSEIANRIAVMQNGKIVEVASIPELLNTPKHAHSKELALTLVNELAHETKFQDSK